jgi:polysaccharide biosynthesis protein PelF
MAQVWDWGPLRKVKSWNGGVMSESDIGILVEGSYPYVPGGVATWVHQLIQSLPEYKFDLIVLLAREEDQGNWAYERPKNIGNITHIALQSGCSKPLFSRNKLPHLDLLQKFLTSGFEIDDFANLLKAISHRNDREGLREALIYSRDSFDLIEDLYEQVNLGKSSFLDFFWTCRNLILGYLNIMTATLPPCKLFHCVSTGYAGLCGASLKILNPESSLVVTEHGIYTRERRMELATVRWTDTIEGAYNPKTQSGLYSRLWTESFSFMSRLCYFHADEIISLFDRNNQIQVNEGAHPSRIRLIRNGIPLERFAFSERTSPSSPPVIGFLGRVVRIKDVKTFIRAASLVLSKIPMASFKIAGGTNESPEYFKDCQALVEFLDLQDKVQFLGPVETQSFFKEVDLLVLTSLSEGQPLVLLEAAAMGVPLVSTDVGGCSEILFGGPGDNFGACGVLTRQANPKETADAIFRLLNEPRFYASCSAAGRHRVESYYDEEVLIHNYRELYSKAMRPVNSHQLQEPLPW